MAASEGSIGGAAVVYFAKAPRPGSVKTRLCPPLTPAEAAGIYRGFLTDVITPVPGARTYVYGWPEGALDELAALVPAGVELRPQRGGDLWARMRACFDELFAAGHDRVVVRNTDSPDLPSDRVERALAACARGRVVLGPDDGGGYYLVGLAEPHPELFGAAAEGSGSVFERTVEVVDAAGLELCALEPWPDVDGYEDLLALWRRRAGSA